MKTLNKLARLQGRIDAYDRTCETRRDSGKGFHKPGADAFSFGNQGPGKKVHRIKRTDTTHLRLRDLAKKFPENPELRRYR